MATTPINLAVAEVVTDLRRGKGMSQARLSELTGIPLTTMQRRLGDGNFTVTELGPVAKALSTTPDEIMSRAADISTGVAV